MFRSFDDRSRIVWEVSLRLTMSCTDLFAHLIVLIRHRDSLFVFAPWGKWRDKWMKKSFSRFRFVYGFETKSAETLNDIDLKIIVSKWNSTMKWAMNSMSYLLRHRFCFWVKIHRNQWLIVWKDIYQRENRLKRMISTETKEIFTRISSLLTSFLCHLLPFSLKISSRPLSL